MSLHAPQWCAVSFMTFVLLFLVCFEEGDLSPIEHAISQTLKLSSNTHKIKSKYHFQFCEREQYNISAWVWNENVSNCNGSNKFSKLLTISGYFVRNVKFKYRVTTKASLTFEETGWIENIIFFPPLGSYSVYDINLTFNEEYQLLATNSIKILRVYSFKHSPLHLRRF